MDKPYVEGMGQHIVDKSPTGAVLIHYFAHGAYVDGYETLVCKKHRKTKQPTADAVIGVRSHLGGRTVLQARVDGRGAEDEIPKS